MPPTKLTVSALLATSLLALAGCDDPDLPAAANAADDADIPDPDDHASKGPPLPPPPRLAKRRWRLSFADEFDGWVPGKDPDCYDANITPPRCATESWYPAGNYCDPAYWPQLADLDKCVWGVHDRYNFWSYVPSGNGVNKLDPSMVSVHDGKLWLNADWNPAAPSPGTPCNHDNPEGCLVFSGGVDSSATGEWIGNTFHFDHECDDNGFCERYGRFEVRARIPVQRGAFPAHWLFHQGTDRDWLAPGEIDFMESVDDAVTHGPHHSVHLRADPNADTEFLMHSKHFPFIDRPQRYAEAFHTFAVEWSPDAIVFYIDELETGRMRVGDPLLAYHGAPPQWFGDTLADSELPAYSPSRWMYFILNTSVQRGGMNAALDGFTPMTHEIDWVRHYTPCKAGDPDPACIVLDHASAEVTGDRWMNVDKWKTALRRLAVGDFDGDGAADLLLQPTAFPGHATYQLLADGAGRFHPESNLTDQSWMNEAKWYAGHRELLTGDFDGDGDSDLLLRPTGPGHAAYLLTANGDGSFANEQTVTNAYLMTPTRWVTSLRDAQVADLDGDGRDDLLLAGKTANESSVWLRGQLGGGFQNRQNISSMFGATPAHWAQDQRRALVADFNADGADDTLLQGRDATRPTYLLMSDGAGGFAPIADVSALYWMNQAKWADAYREAIAGDFNGDGAADVLLRSRALGHATYLLSGDGSGGFDHEVTLDTAADMTPQLWLVSARQAHVGDFNGDGADDLLLQPRADAYGPTLLLPGSPTGFRTVRAITEAQTLGLETWLTTHSELTVADWDGDGAEDLLLRGRDGAVVQDPLLNPQDMVHASDMISDQTYVVYLPPELLL